jgi:protein-S-isoprenylcysteine O-methyltransferase Ste14
VLPQWLLATPALLGIAGGLKLSWHFIRLGDGTPNPVDPPKQLVVASVYRFVRNPGYLAVFGILLSEALYFGSTSLLLYTLFAVCWFHVFVVRIEEPGLRARFGGEYQRFCNAVPRWIPRLRPWDP